MLRGIAEAIVNTPMYREDAAKLRKVMSTALEHAESLTDLIDGDEGDDLGKVLTPIRDFLRSLGM